MKKTKTQKTIVLEKLISKPFVKKVKSIRNLSAVISNLRKDGVAIKTEDGKYYLMSKNNPSKLEKLIIKYNK